MSSTSGIPRMVEQYFGASSLLSSPHMPTKNRKDWAGETRQWHYLHARLIPWYHTKKSTEKQQIRVDSSKILLTCTGEILAFLNDIIKKVSIK